MLLHRHRETMFAKHVTTSVTEFGSCNKVYKSSSPQTMTQNVTTTKTFVTRKFQKQICRSGPLRHNACQRHICRDFLADIVCRFENDESASEFRSLDLSGFI